MDTGQDPKHLEAGVYIFFKYSDKYDCIGS